MNSTPKVSIIIPFYNMEEYLHRCIDSVLNQTLYDLELILVDDGSTDDSLSICQKYAQMDKRVKVIHQENQGVSVARNMGIAQACGDYIGFVDADDKIDKSMYESLLGIAESQDTEIVMCDATTVNFDGTTEEDTITQLKCDQKLIPENISSDLLVEMAGAVWRCIYKKELIEKWGIKFPIGIKFSEDCVFNICAFGKANCIYYVKKSYYYRMMIESSAVNRFRQDFFYSHEQSFKCILEALADYWNGEKNYVAAYSKRFSIQALSALDHVHRKDTGYSFCRKMQKINEIYNSITLRRALEYTDDLSYRMYYLKRNKKILNEMYYNNITKKVPYYCYRIINIFKRKIK